MGHMGRRLILYFLDFYQGDLSAQKKKVCEILFSVLILEVKIVKVKNGPSVYFI